MFGGTLPDSAAALDPAASGKQLYLDSWCPDVPCDGRRYCPPVTVDSSLFQRGDQFMHCTLGAFVLEDECKKLTLSFLATLTDIQSGDTLTSVPVQLDLIRVHDKIFSGFAD